MPEPWRVSFPVLYDPWSKEEHIVYLFRHIANANPSLPPTQGYAIGMDRKGEVRKFTVSLHDYYMAEKRSLIHFIQVDNIRAPEGIITDSEGKAMGAELEPKT